MSALRAIGGEGHRRVAFLLLCLVGISGFVGVGLLPSEGSEGDGDAPVNPVRPGLPVTLELAIDQSWGVGACKMSIRRLVRGAPPQLAEERAVQFEGQLSTKLQLTLPAAGQYLVSFDQPRWTALMHIEKVGDIRTIRIPRAGVVNVTLTADGVSPPLGLARVGWAVQLDPEVVAQYSIERSWLFSVPSAQRDVFRLSVPVGRISVFVRCPGYVDARVEDVDVGSVVEKSVAIRLVQAGSVEVRVRDAEGSDWRDGYVEAVNEESRIAWSKGFRDPKGCFFESLPPGNYTLSVHALDYSILVKERLEVSAGQTVLWEPRLPRQ